MPSVSRPCRGFLIAASFALVGACTTGAGPAPPEVVVRHHLPSQIIVPFGSVGRFRAADGCIYFDREQKPVWRIPALFPSGTRLSQDRRSIVLPNGQSIPFGQKVDVTAESPPYKQVDESCGPRPIQVLSVEDD